MKLVLNGKDADLNCATIAQLWEHERAERAIANPRGVAIALNGALIKRDKWEQTPLKAGDRVEIVRAFAGG